MTNIRRGRRSKFADYEDLLESIPPRSMSKRPKYIRGIGIFRGKTGDTAFVKITLSQGGVIKGKHYKPNSYVEIKVGNLSSFSWQELDDIYRDYQLRADRGELVEEKPIPLFKDYALNWLSNAKSRLAKRGYTNTKGVIHTNLLPCFGSFPLNEITVGHINDWQAKTLENVKPSTLKRRQVVLNSILNTAMREGIIEENPVERVNRIRIAEPKRRYIKKEELKLFLSKAKEVREWLSDYILRV